MMTDPAATRRAVLGGMAVGAGVAALATAAQAQTAPRTYVLVHGAYGGGWIWRRVADMLTAKGHKVFTPTLSGLGERSHLMSGLVTLETHITDVVNVIKWENLENIVLVGHSYGGWVVSGVPEQVFPAIGSIVFLDAFMPEDGQKGLDLNSPRSREAVLAAVARGEVSRPPDSAGAASPMMSDKDRAWLNAKATAQPIGVSLYPIRLTGARNKVAKKTYIRARGYANPTFDAHYTALKADPSWRLHEVPCGHSVMVEMPERLTEILLESA
jgi:pimeloyl-ACP methyl ester carboxylesterase